MSSFREKVAIPILIAVVAGLLLLFLEHNTNIFKREPMPASSPSHPSSQIQVSASTWQLNPALPEPMDFIGWKSSQTPRDFASGTWARNEQVSINENELVLIFGGLANLASVGEIGTNTSCFLIVSRGPNNFSLDLMSARIEISEVESNATSLAWAAQKAKVLRDTYPSTCGNGIDVVIGK